MYIIMYKYSTFKIKRKSFRSSMSKNFPVMADLIGHPSSPAPTGDLTPQPDQAQSPRKYQSIQD